MADATTLESLAAPLEPYGHPPTVAQSKLLGLVRAAGNVTRFARQVAVQPNTIRLLLAGSPPKATSIGRLRASGIEPADWFNPA